MVFSNEQNVERVESRKQENGIFSDNFGGLNLTASNINCPLEDSPNMFNIEVDISGRLRKRRGTKLLSFNTRSSSAGYTLVPFSTGLEYSFLVEKIGKDLFIHEVNNDIITQVMTKTDVWNTAGGNIKATWVISSEVIPRIIFCTGVNQPVQLTFLEQQRIATGTASDFIFPNAEFYADSANLSDLVVYKNRVRVTPAAITYGLGNLTLTGVSVVAGDVIDVVSITWQHMVEALYFTGDRFYQVVSRYNATVTDQILEVPAKLRDSNPVDNQHVRPYEYLYNMYKTAVSGDIYTYVSTQEPSSVNEFAASDGSRYVFGSGNKANPSPFFIVFGAVDGGATPSGAVKEVHMTRKRDLFFLNGGVGVAGVNLKVYVDNVLVPQITSGTGAYKSYYLIDRTNASIVNTTNPAFYLGFQSGNPIGLPFNSEVKIVHATVAHIGSAATQDVADYKDGACYPLFGIGAFSNYYSGAFPRNVTIFQGRLLFSGFINNPLKVVLSELYDKTTPGKFYQNFTIDAFTTSNDDAFDFTLASSASDFVTGMVSWQNSLFILTRFSVFRLAGGDGFVTNTNKTILFISQNGLVNPYAICQTDKSILYLSDSGVYDLFQSIESEQYQAGERSIKIRKVFGITKNPVYALMPWLSFDSINQKVYLGYPADGITGSNYYLFVYNTYRQSWTEYRSTVGFFTHYGTEYIDKTLGKRFILSTSLTYNTSIDAVLDISFVSTEHTSYLDFYHTAAGNGSTTAFTTKIQYKLVTKQTAEGVNHFNINIKTHKKRSALNLLPISSINDVFVSLETSPGSGVYSALVQGVDYQKTPDGNIYLLSNPGDVRNIRFYNQTPRTEIAVSRGTSASPIAVFVNNVFQAEVVNYNATLTGDFYGVTFTTAPSSNSVIAFGSTYRTYWTSPLLTLTSFDNTKRVKWIYAYFDNEEGEELYTAEEVNTAAGQTVDAIVGQPKVNLNVSLGIVYDSEYDAEQVTDIFGFTSLVWDDSLFDLPTPPDSYKRYTLFKESLLGIGYSYQLIMWSFDDTAFALSAYQISPIPYADKYINWTK